MNIIYNGNYPEQTELFKLMEEFIYTNLEDKSLFNKITIHFNEIEDIAQGLSYIGKYTIPPDSPYNPILNISTYAIRLSANAYILSGKEVLNSYEKYRLMVIFHELAHLVNTFNDPELFYIMTKDDNFYYFENEEKRANTLAEDFLKLKQLIE